MDICCILLLEIFKIVLILNTTAQKRDIQKNLHIWRQEGFEKVESKE